MVNNTFTSAFNGLKALVIAGGDTLTTDNAPYF